jgi:hypothetical protein
MAAREAAIINGIRKYSKLRASRGIRPLRLPAVEGLWAVPSDSRPGEAHLVRVVPGQLLPVCHCEGQERTECCWHAMAVGVEAGTIPQRLIDKAYGIERYPRPASAHKTAVPVTA